MDLITSRAVEAEISNWQVRNFIGHAKTFKVLSLSPSGSMCVTCDAQSAAGGVNFPMKCIDCNSCPPSICGSLDSRRRGPHGQMHDIACDVQFSPDGNLMVSLHETGDVLLWDTNTFRVKRAFQIEDEDVCEVRLLACSWSSDGKYLAFATDYTVDEGETVGAVVLYDLGAKGKDQTKAFWRGHGATVLCVSYSPDGQNIACGDKAGCVAVREANSASDSEPRLTMNKELGCALVGSPRAGEPQPSIRWIHYRHDSLKVLSGSDLELTLWDAGDGSISAQRTVQDEAAGTNVREKFSCTCFAPGGWILAGVVSRERCRVVLYNDRFEEVFNFRTKAPPTCMSNSAQRASVGDMFGNHYCVDWELRPKPDADAVTKAE